MMVRALATTITALAVAVAPLSARADASPVRTSVEVDTSQVGEAGPVIQRRIRERSDVVLRGGGVLPSRGAQDPVIVVTVLELTGADPGYAFSLQATRDGEALMHTERFECRLCTETELVAEVEARLQAVIGELETRQADEEAKAQAQVTEPDPAPVDPVPTESQTDDRASNALGTKGKAGIGLLVAGAAGLGVGIGLALKKDVVKDDQPTKAISTHVPGYVLIGVGAALAVTGGVLLGLDRREAKRRTAVAPWVGPQGAGLTVVGRF